MNGVFKVGKHSKISHADGSQVQSQDKFLIPSMTIMLVAFAAVIYFIFFYKG